MEDEKPSEIEPPVGGNFLIGNIYTHLDLLQATELAGLLDRKLAELSRVPTEDLQADQLRFIEAMASAGSRLVAAWLSNPEIDLPHSPNDQRYKDARLKAAQAKRQIVAHFQSARGEQPAIPPAGFRMETKEEWIDLARQIDTGVESGALDISTTPAFRMALEDYSRALALLIDELSAANEQPLPVDEVSREDLERVLRSYWAVS